MQLRFLQLNMCKGRFLPEVINFIKENNFDIVSLQEVSGGMWGYQHQYCFEEIKTALDYNAEIVSTWKDPKDFTSYLGNATFFNKSIVLKGKNVLWLKEFAEVENKEGLVFELLPRAALDIQLEIKGKPLRVINAHLAWGPNEKDDQNRLDQGKKFYNYLKTIDEPYIISGDFNVFADSQIVSWVSEFGKNLISEHGITNTLNPRVHRAKHLFPQGLAVDYIFPSLELKINEFRVINDIDLSDHFGLLLEFEL